MTRAATHEEGLLRLKMLHDTELSMGVEFQVVTMQGLLLNYDKA